MTIVRQRRTFAIIPDTTFEADISDRAFRLLAFLDCWSRAAYDAPEPTKRNIADASGYSISTLDRAIAELITAGLLKIHRRFKDDGSADTSDYELFPAGPVVL